MFWLQHKLRPVERAVKGWSKKSEFIALRQPENELKYSQLMYLHSQVLHLFSAAFALLLHRFIAANPQANPQIFRAFSASFAHAIVRLDFRRLCAANSQELAG